MIAATKPALFRRAVLHPGVAMRAFGADETSLAIGEAEQHQVFAEDAHRLWLCAEIARDLDRNPIAAKDAAGGILRPDMNQLLRDRRGFAERRRGGFLRRLRLDGFGFGFCCNGDLARAAYLQRDTAL